MRVAATAATAVLLLTACGGEDAPKDGRHQYRAVTGSLIAAPPGVTGKPVCNVIELRGGAHPKPRYEVDVDVTKLRGPAQPVFYTVFLTAGGRSYLGYVTSKTARRIPGHTASLLPPDTFGEMRTAQVQPADRVGVMQIPANLTSCQLRIAEPTALELKSGGRGLATVGDESVVMGADGRERPMSER
jgi:hypothetical protein